MKMAQLQKNEKMPTSLELVRCQKIPEFKLFYLEGKAGLFQYIVFLEFFAKSVENNCEENHLLVEFS